ncbi:hypothetical protein [Frisingicoccus sp.]|uniref:hypothetical protein n=1 Tax=Frisingicoccus sp. TaxID=1918627 RepID=UPI003AB4D5BE
MKTSRSKLILIILLSVVVIAAAIAGVVLSMKNKSEEKQAPAAKTSESIVIDEDEISKDRLLKDKYPEVNDLIKRYREALTNGDVEALKAIYNTQDEISADVLTSTSKIIEGYTDTVCYTKKGLEDKSYFVFIYDKLKISGINTPAPNLTMVYVKSTADGTYYIYRGELNGATATYEYDAETQAYIAKLYEDDEVKDLMATVYQEKEAACAKDEALRNFIDGLSSPTSDVTDETSAEAEGENVGSDNPEGDNVEGQNAGDGEGGEAESQGEETQPAETDVVG